ncbi:MAG TPA: hypothetical protein PLU72_16490 [Candidatus Ozemobacteraceae bacterium]|nr:hypothetical protein [Candidatus Ozemobacteraceae bacterium]
MYRKMPANTLLVWALIFFQAVICFGQTATGTVQAEWHVASFSGGVTIERSSRSTEAMSESRNAPIWIGEKVDTRETGQARIDGPDGHQIRLRERTKIRRADVSAWEVESGLAGFRFEQTAGEPPLNLVLSPWAKVEFRSGIVIVKVAPYLTRVAVLKGTAEVTGQGGLTRTLGPKQECAAVPSAISSVYEATDDLYFAWYWDKP